MAKTDVCIDLETLSIAYNAQILTIGAVKFDPRKDELTKPEMDLLYIRVDLDSCEGLNLKIDDSVIDWWATQSHEAQEEAFSISNRSHIKEAFNQLYKFCWGCNRVWSQGAAFDVPICENIFRELKKAIPWKYYQVRDTRTIFDLGIPTDRPPNIKHCAVDDAWAQAVMIQQVTRKLMDLGLDPLKDK